MNARTVDLWAGVGIAAAGLITLFYLIPNYVSAGFGFGLSPRAFPYLCAGAITVLGVFLVLLNLKASRRDQIKAPVARPALRRLLVVLSVLVVTLALMQWAGYLAAAVVCVALLMWMMGERRWLLILLTSVGWSLFLWFLFDRLLGTPLP